ncbi:hypothetical protein [Pectobacterium versatile]|uniref:hypothetical protein n=1 Tax=Pectobacterium versatile TaxID=2488639 RepID=UPI001F2216B6|nr:hypothetical protein [Pectobacterium versatile]
MSNINKIIETLTIKGVKKTVIAFFVVCFLVPSMLLGGVIYASITLPQQYPAIYNNIKIFFVSHDAISAQGVFFDYWRASVFFTLFFYVLVRIILAMVSKYLDISKNPFSS